MSGLPGGWAVVPAGELGAWRGGGTPSKSNDAFWKAGTIPWVSPKDMKRQFISDAEDHITEAAIAGSATQRVPANSILMVTRSGILQHSLPVAINTVPVTVNQDLKTLSAFEGILPEYILWHLQADAQRILEAASKTGTTVESIDFDRLKAYPIRLAPLPEQKRIVAKVGGLTARTARARADLARIPTLIARYKQRLLARAFSGELTNLGPNKSHARTVAIGDVTEISSGYGFPKDRQGKISGDYPFAKVSDISRSVAENDGKLESAANYVDREDLKTLRAKPVAAGSVVFAKIGEALKLNRRATAAVPLIIDNNCMALTPICSKISSAYLLYFMQTVDLGPLSVATAVPSVRRGDVASLQILLPTLTEQSEITRLIESAFNWLDRMSADNAAAAKFLPKLEAAILAKAFRGELVAQDPTDESATALLARIKTQQLDTLKKGRGRNLGPLPGGDHVFSTPPMITRPAKESAMTKSRQDDDVMGKPYLANLLKARRETTAQDLFKYAGLPVADFYKQLAWEIAHKHIRDDDEKLEAL